MLRSVVRHLAAGLLLGLGACTPYLYQHPLGTQPARLGAELRTPTQWEAPAPLRKTVVAWISFATKPASTSPRKTAPASRRPLRRAPPRYSSGPWKTRSGLSPSRENLGNLLNERKIIRSTHQVTARNPAGATARGPVWSFQTTSLPDNRYLFARTVSGNTDIYSSNATGTTVVRLTSAVTVETGPRLSPTRDIIAYASNASGQFQLYTMSRDGSNQRQITTLAVEGYSNAGVGYRWSPDGAQLLYSHYDQLYRVNRDGSGLLLARAPANRHFRECDWTAQNGGRLVVQPIGADPFDSELYLYKTDGTSPVQLVSNLPGRVDSPSFSADGTTVVCTRDVAGFNSASGRQLDAHLFTQKLDGSAAVDVSAGTTSSGSTNKPTGTNDLTPRYTPAGCQLIFVNRSNDDISAPDVYTCDLDGRNQTKLFDSAFLPDYK